LRFSETATKALDQVETQKPGSGRVDLFGFVRNGETGPLQVGGGVDYAHHVTGGVSVFGRGWVGAEKGPEGFRAVGEAVGGMRWRW
jgi:hypothetical protein